MAVSITPAQANSFKQELFEGKHNFLTDTIKYVFLKSGGSGTYSKATTNAGTPGTGTPSTSNVGTDGAGTTGSYTNTGTTIAFDAPTLFTDTVVVHPTSNITLASTNFNAGGAGVIRGMLFFNSTASNRAIACLDFGADVSTTNDTLTITWPTKNGTTGLIRYT